MIDGLKSSRNTATFTKVRNFMNSCAPPLTDQDQTWHDILYHARFYSDRYIPGGPKKVPNFCMALCNEVGEINQQKSMYSRLPS